MKRVMAAVLAATACAAISSAQAQDTEAAAPSLTLDEALAAAGAVSPAIEASRSGIKAAEAQRAVAGRRRRVTRDSSRGCVAREQHGAKNAVCGQKPPPRGLRALPPGDGVHPG